MPVCFDVEIRCCDIRLGLGQIRLVWIHILASLCAHVCLCRSVCLFDAPTPCSMAALCSTSPTPAPAPDPWRPLFSQYGDAALHEAARNGHTGAVEVLLQAKADLNLKNKVWVPGVCFGME